MKMDLKEEVLSAINAIYSATKTEEELRALDVLRDILLPEGETHEQSFQPEDDIEREWLSFAQLQDPAEDDNPFPGCQVENLITNQEDLDRFVHHLYERRYGWSEGRHELKKTQKGFEVENEARNKIYINDHYDALIRWFQWHRISLQLLGSLTFAIKQAASKPVVRNQTVIHSMEWLQSHASSMAEAHYPHVKTVVLLGVTDVWSAIRNACVARLSHVLELFSVGNLENFFNGLVTICQSQESTWQAKEGAVMGINNMVRHFQWMSQITVEEVDESDTQDEDSHASLHPHFFLKFGAHEFRGMPSFITSKMREVIFPLLAHPQLSIREHAIKAFSSFLGRCEFKGALSAFRDVICRLCRGTGVSEDLKDYTTLPHLAILSPDYKFLDAYEAEGLLGVCVFLVKHIPPNHLLPAWPLYFSTFSLYLSHPASTVRQATSSIFKFIVARDSHSPVILKLVLQGLSNGWMVRRTALDIQISISQPSVAVSHPPDIPAHLHPGSAGRLSITAMGSSPGEHELTDTWEWREGRLLAYELILKFLIKNHCLYTFGPPHLNPMFTVGGAQHWPQSPRVLQPGCSADHAFFFKEKEKEAPTQSRSYAGSSLHTALHRTSSEKLQRSSVQPPLSSSPLNTTPTVDILPGIDEEEGQSGSIQRSGSFSRTSTMSPRVTPDEAATSYFSLTRPAGRGRNSICTSSPVHQLAFNNNWMTQLTLGASDASILKQPSRPLGLGESSSTQRTLVRHYSFFAEKQDGSTHTPSAIPGDNSLNRALSLLMHTLATDLQEEKNITTPSQTINETVRQLRRPSLGDDIDGQCGWLRKVELQSLAIILETVLYQSIESLADVQWELRRMGQQLLPCIVEVIRWFDMCVLEKLWNEHLQSETNILTYGACLALKYSLTHAAKLAPMTQTVPPTWQDPEMCIQVVLRITTSIGQHLSTWISVVHSLLQRPLLDKLTAVAMETIMLAHTHFIIPPHQKHCQVQSVVEAIRMMFSLAHPKASLSARPGKMMKTKYHVPSLQEGYLSCCVRPSGPEQNALQTEKYVLENIHTVLGQFLQGSPITITSPLLPILSAYVCLYAQNDAVHKDVLESLNILGNCCHAYLVSESREADQATKIRDDCAVALKQLAHVITIKSVEATLLRQVLDLYTNITRQVHLSTHLPALLRAMSTRSNAGAKPTRTGLTAYLGHVENGNADLTLLSNDIPILSTPPPDLPSDSDEEQNMDMPNDVIQESQMLDTSGNSSNPGLSSSVDGRGVSPLPDASDGGSDWDSWSDEEEDDDSAVANILGEFLQKMHTQASGRDDLTKWTAIISHLPPGDLKIIKGLLSAV